MFLWDYGTGNNDNISFSAFGSTVVFDKNISQPGAGGISYGGGIFVYTGNVYIVNNSMVQFIGNRAYGNDTANSDGGGAIRVGLGQCYP